MLILYHEGRLPASRHAAFHHSPPFRADLGLPDAAQVHEAGVEAKPVNNIADVGRFPWNFIAAKPEHRCLIPLTGFCGAESEKGAKTRIGFAPKDRPLFAWAGMWKHSDEWGAAFSGLMTDCNDIVRPVHNQLRHVTVIPSRAL